MGSQPPRQRDAERSRAAILDAAEALFAAHGFASVTMAQVGAAAGVSRGTPGYFFGSKEALHRAVLDRAIAELDALGRRLGAQHAGTTADGVVAGVVDELLELAAARPSLVRLVDAHAASGDGNPHADAVATALGGFGADHPETALTVLALCWFPVSQPGAARGLGVDPSGADFARTWRDRVLAAVAGEAPATTARVPAQAAPAAAEPEGPPAHEAADAWPGKKKKKKKKGKG
jgi:AcrR family transcriptional regulator